ncbi:MAG: coenzyme F420-0:L-glutamate ligase [Erysipelotrichaceae bacterium]|jgi:F420-0:gamma-glutamyl ligase-like protein|nr:coenzyme F420-0:L-glutamate ligase [Erysipelotrichaceae bacterium]
MSEPAANPGKNLVIHTDFGDYARYPLKTHVIMDGDDLYKIMDDYVKPWYKEGDTVIISEKIVAISQGRAFPVSEIKISWLAKFLCRFVTKTDAGIGIGSPATMELCIRAVGVPKILFAAVVAGVGKLFGQRGLFYKICGPAARAIDGPCDYTLPPYNTYAKMAPDKPNLVASNLSKHLGGNDVVVIDANDLGVNVLGKSRSDLLDAFCEQVFKDNPLGQMSEQTPIALVRKA